MSEKIQSGIVDYVSLNGKHGPYAVCNLENLGSVTFSLDNDVWNEKTFPSAGVYVVLEDLVKKRAGWRALKARFLRPDDEQ